jgi:branched-chain amino acid aminotransferase
MVELELLKPQVIMLHILPNSLANAAGFQQVIGLMTYKMEEAGTMNVFFRINDTLFTAPTSERIDGITRKSLIDLAEKEGILLKFVLF